MRTFPIVTGNSRQSAVWPASRITFDDLYERLRTPLRTSETVEQYQKMTKGERDEAKDKGGFMAGILKGTRRRKTEVVSRSMITLDGDKLTKTFLEEYGFLYQYASIVYTTHSHTPDAPRARIVIPLTRDVSVEEANAISRLSAAEWGIEMFDPCSYEVNQLMYWPTCPDDGEYICERYDGELLDPDEFLAGYPDWKDASKLPQAPSEKRKLDNQQKKQEDPLTKNGVVGLFCRTYSITSAIETFLSDVYEATDDDARYHYRPSDSIPGVIIYDDKFAYSHHASDPAYGKLLNAFDLVRVHLFGDEEPKASFDRMAEFAAADEAVRALGLDERRQRAEEDFADEDDGDEEWKKKLIYAKKSTSLENNLYNIKLIMQNDRYLKNIVFNQLADNMEIAGEVPWEHPGKFWRDADDAQLICYVDDNYGTFSARNYDVAVTKTVDDRSYHPIRSYFESLPEWDKIPRVDTAMIDYLGAEDNAYVRAVTRKTLCAAYRRVYEPGIKFDYMPVLNGDQGIGKSTFIARLGMEWFSDSLNLSDMNDKTAAEKLQGYWILEIGELAGMKKADLDKVKAFVSRCDDKYRASFGRRVTPHPRQCVFFGTTNNENGYLRDITGNRRYWNVRVTGKSKWRPWDMTPDIVGQIWAEVKVLADKGEKLFLPAELEEYAKAEQRAAMEQDDREGIVAEYLDMLLPETWDTMDSYQRREFVRDVNDITRTRGTVRRMQVSNMEIWCECFGRNKEDMRPSDSYNISAIMARLTDWEKSKSKPRIPIYGQQRVYIRKCDNS